MAERIRDSEDLRLETLFSGDPIADDGFSARIVSQVRRRMWIRRLSLPVAIGIGVLISAKPLIQIAGALPGLVTSVFGSSFRVDHLPFDHLPQLSTILFGAALVMALLLAGRLLEE